MKTQDKKQDNCPIDEQNDTRILSHDGDLDAKMCVHLLEDDFVLNIKIERVVLADFVNKFLKRTSNQDFAEKEDMAIISPQSQASDDAGKDSSHPECSSLTDRECDILTRLSKGMLNKEIANEMGLSINTVKNHLQNIYSKLCVENRTEAILRFLERVTKKDKPGF